MTNASDGGEGVVRCPACGSSIRRGIDARCGSCGIDATHPALEEILAADATLYGYKATYDELLTNWQALSLRRHGLLGTLVASRFGAPAEASAAAFAPVAAASTAPRDVDPFARTADADAPVGTAPTGTFFPSSDAAAAPAEDATAAPAWAAARGSAPVATTSAQPSGRARPARAPKPARQIPRRLTAPALLGVSGASLLITSAIVFIAVTWQTFFPLAQGLIITAVAAAAAYLSLWLKRHDLSVSGGAVGVVAMSFVGVAFVAVDRQAGVLGTFALPVAGAFTAGAGLALSRRGVLWVGSTAALALGASAVGLTRAIAVQPRVDDRLAWALVGPALALALLATFRLWATAPSRAILRVVGVAFLTLAPLPLLLDIAWNGRSAVSALAVVVPLVGLVALGVPWPRFTLAPASALATTVVAALFWGGGATQAQTVAAVAGATVVIAAACAIAPLKWRNPVLLGLAPAGMAIAAAAIVVAVQLLVLLGGGGRVATWLPFSPYSGIAVIIGGIALAAPGLWKPPPRWLRPVAVVGSVFVVVGVAEAAYSIAIRTWPLQVWAVSACFTIGSVVSVLSALLWRSIAARWVAGIAATVLATIAGLDGAWALAVAEIPAPQALACALVPLALLVAFGLKWPRVTQGSAALVASAIGAGIMYLAVGTRPAAITGAIFVVAVVLWGAARLPSESRAPILAGVAPGLVLALAVGFGSVVPILAGLAANQVPAGGWAYGLWTSATTSLAGIALGAPGLWTPGPRWSRSLAVAASAFVVAGITEAAYSVAIHTWPGEVWAVSASFSVGAVACILSALLWQSAAARWVAGIAATALATIAGLDGAWALGVAEIPAPQALACALVPLGLLLAFGPRWPRVTLGPAALVASAIGAGTVYLAVGTRPAAITGAIFVAAIILWAGARLPSEWKVPVLFGATPALAFALAVGLASIIPALAGLSGNNVSDDRLAYDLWTSATTVLAGLALAAPERWKPQPRWLRHVAVSVVGSVLVVMGIAEAAYWVAIRTWPGEVWAVSACFTVGAVVGVLSALLWRSTPARWVAGIGATLLATIAGLDGAWAFGVAEIPAPQALACALIPLALLVAFGSRWPSVTLGPAALVASAVGAGTTYLTVGTRPAAITGAVLVVAIILWSGVRFRAEWKLPILFGATPALALALAVAVGSVVPVLAGLVASHVPDAGWAYDLWTSATTALAGLALGALPRWRVGERLAGAISIAGSVVVTTAAASVAVSLTDQWGGDPHQGLAVNVAILALVSAALTVVWATTTARLAHGIGATVLLGIAGIQGCVAFAEPSASLGLGLAVVVAPVVILVVFARWWPSITLGPASFLFTLAIFSIDRHAEMSDASLFALVSIGIALTAWACWITPTSWWKPMLVGVVPATLAALGVGFWAVVIAAERAVFPGDVPVNAPGAAWSIVGLAALGAAAMSSRRWGETPRFTGVVEVLGGAAWVGAAVAGTALTGAMWHGSSALVPVAAMAYSGVAAATARLWSQRVASWTVGGMATAWVTLVSLVSLGILANKDVDWWQGVGAVSLVVVVLATVGYWWPRVTLGSAALLGSLLCVLAVVGAGGTVIEIAFASVLATAVLAWIATLAGAEAGPPLSLGTIPVGILSPVVLVAVSGLAIARLVTVVFRDDRGATSAWGAGIAVAALVGLLSLSRVRRAVTWVAVPFLVVASASLPGHATWIALGVIAAAALAAYHYAGPRLHISADAVMVTALVACVWAARADGSLAVMTGVVTAMALSIAVRHHGELRIRALWLAPVTGAVSAGTGAIALGFGAGVALAAAMIGAIGISIGSAAAGLDRNLAVTPVIVGIATVVIPLASPAATRSGVALIIAGAGWLALAVLDWRPGRWLSSAVLSLGTALVMAGARVTVIEAYVAVPAISVLVIGLWWLADDPEMRTFRALGPGLAVGLIPSLITLATDPTHLARTLALTGATVALAVVGVAFRWFAPILATSVTAVTVSFTQVFSSEQIVPRWVSFGVVGSLLLAIAATYEKLKKLR